MTQFQFKFYREWYDALAELSHEERAEAALALLEYAYDDKIPEDKFIRIVTTLMRNKIDKEKSSSEKSRQRASSASKPIKTSEVTENQESSEITPMQDNQNSTVTTEVSENTESETKDDEMSEQIQLSSNYIYIQIDEAKAWGITREIGHEINQILRIHYNPENEDLIKICNKNNIPPTKVRENAKFYMVELARRNEWQPHPLSDRSQPSFLHQIDNEALKKSHKSI